MLTQLRRAQILADARQQGGVSLRELSHRFEVSIPTIRRDLSALADQGLVRRVHGGALAIGSAATWPRSVAPGTGSVARLPAGAASGGVSVAPPSAGTPAAPSAGGDVAGDVFVPRPAVGLAAAVAMVGPGMAVGISGGPLAVRLAGLLEDVPGLTVVTPVPAVAGAVRAAQTVVVLVGGVRTPSGNHAGPLTERTLAWLNLDIAFVELRQPAVTGDALADATDQAMLRRATSRVFLTAAEM